MVNFERKTLVLKEKYYRIFLHILLFQNILRIFFILKIRVRKEFNFFDVFSIPNSLMLKFGFLDPDLASVRAGSKTEYTLKSDFIVIIV